MSINFDKAGPSGIQSERTEIFSQENKQNEFLSKNFKFPAFESDDGISPGKFSFKMNEIYMKGIKNGTFEIPNYSMEVYNRHPFSRCHKRRRRDKFHPYLSENMKISKNEYILCSQVEDTFESPYRLRTTSLTSGTGGKRPTIHIHHSTNCQLSRSKSMEDLNGTSDECSQKSKDFDTVYKGIQQLHMQDNV